ncbi:hypothetical protein PR048_031612, partial [Dryococelus australis]
MDINVNDAATLVKACCALHKFVRERDGVNFSCTLSIIGLEEGDALIQTSEHPIFINSQRKVCAILFQRRRIFARSGQAQTDGSSRYHTPPKVARVQDSTRLCGDTPQSPVCKHFRLYNARSWDTTTPRPSRPC